MKKTPLPLRAAPLIAMLLPLAACQDAAPASPSVEPTPEASGEPIVALYTDEAGLALGGKGGAVGVEKVGKSFYLGVRRDLLGERWFLSAYLKSLYPGSFVHSAQTLGTRVVSFRVQNGQLFVFDVDDRNTYSDTLDPEVVLDAYPLVDPGKLGHAGGFGDYVVFDPAAGQNRFSVLNDAQFDNVPVYESPLEVEVTYSQNFRAIDDGVTFEQVFGGYFRDPGVVYDFGQLETNEYRVSGTLGLSLRRYQEGEGFVTKLLPGKNFYFRSVARQQTNSRKTNRPVTHWNLAPGMAPIRWAIAPSLVRAQAERFPDYDLVSAFKRGVESWNDALGFEALKADLASPEQSFADDDVNYLIYDENAGALFAFADWRVNPNTGEIRGASVYFPETYVKLADDIFSDGASALSLLPKPGEPPPARFAWGALSQKPLCTLGPEALFRQHTAGNSDPPLPKKEMVERYVAHVVAHEIGHTLGLRHNFKGSLVPPSSSVMEYVIDEDAVFVPDPGSYDVDAVRYLYDQSTTPPAQPFCTDEDVAFDPLCNRSDRGEDPLAEFFAPNYRDLFEPFARGEFFPDEEFVLVVDMLFRTGEVLDYVRAADTSEAKLAAWEALFAPLRTPLDPTYLPENVDLWTHRLLTFMSLEDPADLIDADIESPVVPDPLLTPRLSADLRDIVVDEASFYGIETRGEAIDTLKRLRAPAALLALDEARAALEAKLPSLEGEPKALAQDLLRHIESVTSPYFD